jgi:hypothetical protein
MDSYLVGNRVYRGASNAPTRGTVDPMGYINRSIASPVGGDGMSDKRSGLAQAALMRLQGMQGPQQGSGSNSQQQGPPPIHPEATPNAPVPGLGFTVSPTGQLIPTHPDPAGQTLTALGASMSPPNPEASEPELMQAARERLSHHLDTREMMAKHHLSMEKLQMQAAEMINRHGKAVRSNAS